MFFFFSGCVVYVSERNKKPRRSGVLKIKTAYLLALTILALEMSPFLSKK